MKHKGEIVEILSKTLNRKENLPKSCRSYVVAAWLQHQFVSVGNIRHLILNVYFGNTEKSKFGVSVFREVSLEKKRLKLDTVSFR